MQAERLRKLLTRLGPAFVKIGQAVSSRPDVTPPSYTYELEKLQDQIPPFNDAQAMQVILEELGRPASSVFSSMTPSPVAAASLGQVHLLDCATIYAYNCNLPSDTFLNVIFASQANCIPCSIAHANMLLPARNSCQFPASTPASYLKPHPLAETCWFCMHIRTFAPLIGGHACRSTGQGYAMVAWMWPSRCSGLAYVRPWRSTSSFCGGLSTRSVLPCMRLCSAHIVSKLGRWLATGWVLMLHTVHCRPMLCVNFLCMSGRCAIVVWL